VWYARNQAYARGLLRPADAGTPRFGVGKASLTEAKTTLKHDPISHQTSIRGYFRFVRRARDGGPGRAGAWGGENQQVMPDRGSQPGHVRRDRHACNTNRVANGAVGFDLDMTLIDSRLAILASFTATGGELGVTIDLDQTDARLGIKLEDELSYWFPPEQIAAAADIYRRHYLSVVADRTTAMPGAAAAIAAVRAVGDRAVIITAKSAISVQPSLRAVGLDADETYPAVHGPGKTVVLKKISATVYVGDTPSDMAAATAAGVTAVGVPTGSFTATDLKEAGADVVLASLTEFPGWYGRSRPPRHR
jgi:phosphoglycolate phosphatase